MSPKLISSRHNAQFRLLQDVVDSSRGRREHGKAWIEGERLCDAYLRSNWPAAIAVISSSSEAAIPAVLQTHRDRMSETWLMDPKLFALISTTETPVGWGLLIPLPDTQDAKGAKSVKGAVNEDVVVLDRIQDPGNLGAVLRCAAAAGIRHAWCLSGSTDPWSPKVLRSAMGAHFVMQLETAIDEHDVVRRCAQQGLQLLAAAHREHATSLYSPTLDVGRPTAWIFGNEANGVSESLLAQSIAVAIPQSSSVESLNVAVAAGVCLFEMRRRRLTITP